MADPNEHTPLISTSGQDGSVRNSWHKFFSYKTLALFLFGIVIGLLLALNVLLFFAQSKEPQFDPDLTEIPYHYQLRATSRYPINYKWDYAIERPPPLDLEKVKNMERKKGGEYLDMVAAEYYWGNSTARQISTRDEHYLNAELVARSYSAHYEVREERRDDEKRLSLVSTVNAYLTSIWFSPSVIVQFNPPLGNRLESTAKEACEYKLTGINSGNGWIWRRCSGVPGQRKWSKISYAQSVQWGVEFLDPKADLHYAVAAPPSYGWDELQRRTIFVYSDAPFPPVIPAIYAAYYDYAINKQSAERRRRNDNGDE